MARCATSGEKFIHFVFSPCVSVLTSSDVEKRCLQDNLTFTELLKPFSQLTKDVSIRDSNNLVHTLSNLRIKFLNAATPPPTATAARTNLREVVRSCSCNQSLPMRNVSNGSLAVAVPTTTPWFEAWRYVFIQSLWPGTHEFMCHSLACLIVVSTSNPDPLAELIRLSDEQTQQQQQRSGDASYPRWFTSNIVKFYVVVHDVYQGDRNRADVIHKQVERHFGSASCYFLPLFTSGPSTDHVQRDLVNGENNSKPVLTNSRLTEDAVNSDPWLTHLLPDGFQVSLIQDTSADDCPNPSSVNHDPLLVDGDDQIDCNHIEPEGDKAILQSLIYSRHFKPHGRSLTQTDCDQIKTFVYEFVVRSLLPWVEQTMRCLNDQVAHRMRLSRSLLSATKKFFTSAVSSSAQSSLNSASANALSQPPSLLDSTTTPSLIGMSGSGGNWPPTSGELVMTRNTVINSKEDVRGQQPPPPPNPPGSTVPVVVYTAEAPEMQMRRLADLAFLFQQYEVAYQTYNVLKRDFQNDGAWLHYAAAQEMSALSIYLQGANSQRQYPYHYVDSSVTIYLQTCQSAELALRATLVNAEALCSRGLFAEAAMSLLRLTSQDDDLTSGLLIEQTAHCVLRLRRPLLRKFGFRLALAAHRYNRARQSHLTIRTYNVAAPILAGRRWSLIEDHINFNVGKQAYLIGDLANAVVALRRNLTQFSRQPAERQSLFIREYLVVLKQFLAKNMITKKDDSTISASYAVFPLPLVRFRDLQVMLGKPVKHGEGRSVKTEADDEKHEVDLSLEARGIQFADFADLVTEKHEVESFLTLNALHNRSNHWQDWMENTDVSDLEEDPVVDDKSDSELYRAKSNCNHVELSNTVIPGLLEEVLSQTEFSDSYESADSRKQHCSGICQPHPILYSIRSACAAQTPVAPVGEYVTVRIPLENPMQIPLVFSNLHLLWAFQPELSDSSDRASEPRKPITNETPFDLTYLNRQIVASEVIPELIMLPSESKALDITVLSKQLGKLEISGLCFDWIYPSSQHLGSQNQGVTYSTGQSQKNGDIPSNLTNMHSSHILSNENSLGQSTKERGRGSDSKSVRGKIYLSMCKEDSLDCENISSSLPLPPHLSWTITRSAALLRVTFSDFPIKLMQGELFPLTLSLTNAGSQPLGRIHVASNWFGFIGLRLDTDHHRMDKPITIETTSAAVSNNLTFHRDPPIQPWLQIPAVPYPIMSSLTDASLSDKLLPGTSVAIPMWFRAPHLSSPLRRSGLSPAHHWHSRRTAPTPDVPVLSEQRTVHMVFQYTSLTPNPIYPELNTRFVRHRSDLELQPSLRFKALATRKTFSGPSDLFIQLIIQNVTSNTFRCSFEVLQISCASRFWVLNPIVNEPDFGKEHTAPLAPGEVMTLSLRGSLRDSHLCANKDPPITDDGETMFSTVPLSASAGECTREIISPSSSPCVDFYYRSGCVVKRRRPKRVSQFANMGRSADLDITLIIFWRRLVAPSHMYASSYGQSHVPLIRLDHPVSVPSEYHDHTNQKACKLGPTSESLGDIPDALCSSPSVFDATEMVQFRLRHPFHIQNRFLREAFRSPLSSRSPLTLNPPPGNFTFNQSCILGAMTSFPNPEKKCTSFLKIPVSAELFNTTTLPVLVKLDAVPDENRESASSVSAPLFTDNPMLNSSRQPDAARVLWTGITRKSLLLRPGESRKIKLNARMVRPGFFDTSSLVLRAALVISDKEPVNFVRQVIPQSFFLADHEKS